MHTTNCSRHADRADDSRTAPSTFNANTLNKKTQLPARNKGCGLLPSISGWLPRQPATAPDHLRQHDPAIKDVLCTQPDGSTIVEPCCLQTAPLFAPSNAHQRGRHHSDDCETNHQEHILQLCVPIGAYKATRFPGKNPINVAIPPLWNINSTTGVAHILPIDNHRHTQLQDTVQIKPKPQAQTAYADEPLPGTALQQHHIQHNPAAPANSQETPRQHPRESLEIPKPSGFTHSCQPEGGSEITDHAPRPIR